MTALAIYLWLAGAYGIFVVKYHEGDEVSVPKILRHLAWPIALPVFAVVTAWRRGAGVSLEGPTKTWKFRDRKLDAGNPPPPPPRPGPQCRT